MCNCIIKKGIGTYINKVSKCQLYSTVDKQLPFRFPY